MVATGSGNFNTKSICFHLKNVCVAPKDLFNLLLQVPIYLAAGTAAQQLDASFSTESDLEIYGRLDNISLI